MVEWQASAFVFLCAREFRKPNTTTKADFLPLHFGEGIGMGMGDQHMRDRVRMYAALRKSCVKARRKRE